MSLWVLIRLLESLLVLIAVHSEVIDSRYCMPVHHVLILARVSLFLFFHLVLVCLFVCLIFRPVYRLIP